MVLCDTNGGTLPHEIAAIVADVNKHVPGSHLGIHTHNDTENAVANTLAAVRAGARQIQGTLNGLGERCGNANLASHHSDAAAEERVRRPFRDQRDARAADASSPTPAALLDEILNRAPNRQAPYVGEAAFATKAGIHASAILKEPADLRARAARKRRQPAPRAGVGPGRQVEPAVMSWNGSASPSTGTTRASRDCSKR